jgi:hypothetical protein
VETLAAAMAVQKSQAWGRDAALLQSETKAWSAAQGAYRGTQCKGTAW